MLHLCRDVAKMIRGSRTVVLACTLVLLRCKTENMSSNVSGSLNGHVGHLLSVGPQLTNLKEKHELQLSLAAAGLVVDAARCLEPGRRD